MECAKHLSTPLEYISKQAGIENNENHPLLTVNGCLNRFLSIPVQRQQFCFEVDFVFQDFVIIFLQLQPVGYLTQRWNRFR